MDSDPVGEFCFLFGRAIRPDPKCRLDLDAPGSCNQRQRPGWIDADREPVVDASTHLEPDGQR